MYDLIGDIHGHAAALETLLRSLGYRPHGCGFRHPNRRALFVGDFIDRGPEIARTLKIVRGMVDAGDALAVMGNHEINALAFHTRDPDSPRRHLRRRSRSHRGQHAETLAQVPRRDLRSHLEWFRSLPFWLELDGLRVVHACWDEPALAVVREARERHGGASDSFLIEAHHDETLLYEAVEILLKGKEMALPPAVSFLDKDGQRRRRVRVRWYLDPAGHDLSTYSLPAFADLPAARLPARAAAEARPYPAAAPPVFFGHYWLDDPEPAQLAHNVACLDYSVARGGFLCGYRFDGEPRLDPRNYVRTR